MISPAVLPQLQRALALHQAGKNAEAWMIAAPLRQAIENHGQALRAYALMAGAVDRADEAIDALKRIAALEGDPVEILGAIADTLGKAGRHAEAYDRWSAMVRRYPKVNEAHLNRAVAASSAALHDEAIAAADEGLRHFPGEARLLATKAMALKNGGRVLDAIPIFEQAVAADPKRALTRQNQAVTLRAACRFEEACAAFEHASKLGMKGAPFLANWAAAALEANRIDEAEALYVKALAIDPVQDEARKGLTRLRIEYRGGEDAFAHFEDAAARQANNPDPWLAWARALIANRRTSEALEVTERGIRSNPASGELRAIRAFARGMTDDPVAALAELEELLRGHPQDSPQRAIVAQIAFRANRPDKAAEVLENRVARNPEDQLSWAMLGLAWRLLDDPREYRLCDYDRFVMTVDVPPPDGSLEPADYAAEVASILDPLHVASSEPGDQTLRGGTQTSGALFSRPDAAIQRFREAVSRAADQAVSQLPDDPDHPFLSRKSHRFGFSGSWSVRLGGGGHHVSHVHPEGWMSSAYYARLPTMTPESRSRHEGWIQFGVPPEHLGIELPPRRLVEPRPGRLVLFPSYMWHGTIPFGDGDRLTAAFDYQPL